MYYDDINVTKRKTITNGVKYDFFIYNMLSLEKKFSNGKFGKGETVISEIKDSRKVHPQLLLKSGYDFKYDKLEKALKNILK